MLGMGEGDPGGLARGIGEGGIARMVEASQGDIAGGEGGGGRVASLVELGKGASLGALLGGKEPRVASLGGWAKGTSLEGLR
jgi:hypothetical protein